MPGAVFPAMGRIAWATECWPGGYVDLVIEGGLSPYDIMPLVPIVEGAGGTITDWQGNSAVNGGLVVAASGKRLHDEVLEYLGSDDWGD